MKSKGILKFPNDYLSHRYGLIHFSFFVQTAKIAPLDVELVASDDTVFVCNDQLIFSCQVGDQQIIIDYADHSTRNWKDLYPGLPYFKFQTTDKISHDYIPLGPPMVGVKMIGAKGATLREYSGVRYHYNYQPGQRILCKQRPNGAAVERRNMVHELLVTNFSDVDIASNNDQLDFWKDHENCLAAVCVPGATNNMVDRGHAELLGLGVCTVSPNLETIFPYHQKLISDQHYIRCSDDYSDLVDIIRDLEKNPEKCKQVGNAARKFYEDYYTPSKYWQWILENIQ